MIVVGVPVFLNERGVVLAKEISGMNGTRVLRDDDGVRYGSNSVRKNSLSRGCTMSGQLSGAYAQSGPEVSLSPRRSFSLTLRSRNSSCLSQAALNTQSL